MATLLQKVQRLAHHLNAVYLRIFGHRHLRNLPRPKNQPNRSNIQRGRRIEGYHGTGYGLPRDHCPRDGLLLPKDYLIEKIWYLEGFSKKKRSTGRARNVQIIPLDLD